MSKCCEIWYIDTLANLRIVAPSNGKGIYSTGTNPQKVFLKDSIIFSLNTKTSNFENILYTKQDQLSISQELTRNLQTDLKKQKLKTKLFGGTGILIAAGVIFILK